MKKFWVVWILLILGIKSHAIDFSPRAVTVFDYLYTLKMDSAQYAYDELKLREPNNRIDGYLAHTKLFLELFASEDPKVFEARKGELETYLYRVRQEPNRNAMSYYCEGEMLLQQASIYAKFGETFTAGRRALTAYEIAEALVDAHPTFEPGIFLLGLVEVGLGSLPGTYRWIIGVFGYEGEISQGMVHLRKGYESSLKTYPHFRIPFAFTFGYAVFQLGLKPDLRMAELGVQPEESILLIFLESSLLMSQGNNSEALVLLMDRPVEGLLEFPYLYYMEGKTRIAVMDKGCIEPFNTYLSIYKGKHYIKSTYRYLMWADQIWNDGLSSWQYKDWISNKGNEYMGADKEAVLELSEPLTLPLIKARLSFDSGAYLLALNYLEEVDAKKGPWYQKVEYAYRMGRVYEGMQKYEEAEKWYLKCISENAQRDTYQGASAAIHLGYLHEAKLRNSKRAASFYSLAMGFSDYPYYPGMYRKAKAGYERSKK